MSYSCVYEDTIFYDPKNKHSIIRVRTKDNSIPNKARKATNSRDDFIRFVAKGYNLPQTNKISMILDGEWENSKYGTQLNVESCEEIVPYTDEGMKGYLSSCLVKGIGAVTADEIIKRFGADTQNTFYVLLCETLRFVHHCDIVENTGHSYRIKGRNIFDDADD